MATSYFDIFIFKYRSDDRFFPTRFKKCLGTHFNPFIYPLGTIYPSRTFGPSFNFSKYNIPDYINNYNLYSKTILEVR